MTNTLRGPLTLASDVSIKDIDIPSSINIEGLISRILSKVDNTTFNRFLNNARKTLKSNKNFDVFLNDLVNSKSYFRFRDLLIYKKRNVEEYRRFV